MTIFWDIFGPKNDTLKSVIFGEVLSSRADIQRESPLYDGLGLVAPFWGKVAKIEFKIRSSRNGKGLESRSMAGGRFFF